MSNTFKNIIRTTLFSLSSRLKIRERIIYLFLDKTEIILLGLKSSGFLIDSGWLYSSLNRRCSTKEGKPIPWLTYSSIYFLQSRVKKEFNIFEFGSGYSTLYWAERVQHITTVEHDHEWYEKVKKMIIHLSNISLIECELKYNETYCKTAANSNQLYHMIIIDGRDRNNCIKNSFLNP